MKFRLIIFFLLSSFFVESQEQRLIDSLKLRLKTQKEDTLRLNILNRLVENISDDGVWPAYNTQMGELAKKLMEHKNNKVSITAKKYFGNYLNNAGYICINKGKVDSGLYFFKRSLKIDEELGSINGQAYAENNIGIIYMNHGDIEKALDYFNKGLEKYRKTDNKAGQALSLNNIGFIYNNKGDIVTALDYYHKSLKLREETRDKNEQGISHLNIGSIYEDMEDFDNALASYNTCLQLFTDAHNKQGKANAMNNLGGLYFAKKNYGMALGYYKNAATIYRETEDKHGQAISTVNVGMSLFFMGRSDSAMSYLKHCIKMYEELDEKDGIAHGLNNFATVLFALGKTAEAKEAALRSLRLSEELKFPEKIAKAAELLSKIYTKEKNWEKALKMQSLYMAMRDSTHNTGNEKATFKQQMKYEYEKRDAVATAEQERKNLEIAQKQKQQKIITWAIGGGLFLVIVFSGFLYRRFKITEKQKKTIEAQKKEVEKQKEIADSQRIIAIEQREVMQGQKKLIEEINKGIVDSINYAKRIQQAILPTVSEIQKHFPETFVLYKPKDIVAGDFFWFHHSPGSFFLAACDCTGHGVPGAMVSVVCSNALNRAVNEFNLSETGSILDKVRELVVETFEKSDKDVKDGMDISLLKIENSEPGKPFVAQWSGANNPLWYFDENEFKVIKADKQPIGKFEHASPFTTHHLILKQETVVYLFTDGYADQFGGESGKKFRKRQLSELLKTSFLKPMNEQKEILNTSFENWRGSSGKKLEQIDDVCIIGIRV